MPKLRRVKILLLTFLFLVLVLISGGWLFDLFAAMTGVDAEHLWTTPYFYLGEKAITLAVILQLFLFLMVLVILSKLVRGLLQTQILPRTSFDSGQQYTIVRAAGYLIFTLGILIGLHSSGLNLSSLAFLGGTFGIILGFGLQNISSNFVSGLILLVERPLKVGDRIEVGTLNGDVTHIGARSTWVRTNENVVIIVPNSEFISNRVTNWTANDRRVRFSMPVGVSYGSEPHQVRDILLDVASQHPDVMTTYPPEALFVGFGDSSLDFELRFWTQSRVQTPKALRSDLYYELFSRFHEAGIEIPFPQHDLHLRSIDPNLQLLRPGSPAPQGG